MHKKYLGLFLVVFIALPIIGISADNIPELVACKKHLKDYVVSGEYNKQLESVCKPGMAYLKNRIKENNQLKHPKKLAVVFDIDETLLSNYNMMQAYSFGGNSKLFSTYEKKSKATLITPTAKIFHYAIDHNVAVFLITGRENKIRKETVLNLVKRHLTGYKKLDMWPMASIVSVGHYKSQKRCSIQDKGYEIVLNIGDQNSDMDFDCLGEKTIKLPNPFYYIPSNQVRKHPIS